MNNIKHILLSALTVLLLFTVIPAQHVQLKDSRGTVVPGQYLNTISVDFKNLELREALNSISEKGGFKLNFIETLLPIDKYVTKKITGKPAAEILKILLYEFGLDFIITKSGQLVLIPQTDSSKAIETYKYTVSGFITDKGNGEALIGTNVLVYGLDIGAAANSYGFYSLTLPAGEYRIRVSYIGYETEEIDLLLYGSFTKNIELKSEAIVSDTIIVATKAEEESYESTEMSTVKLSPDKLTNIPFLFGEQDILKVLHLLPGVTASREGDTGFYVRGGASDQNLVLLDEAPVYNAFHFFGFFSVFNSDAIKNIRLMKGAAPPKYGGRVSSVLDIQMNEGNMKEYKGSAGIGLIFSRLNYQGPIVKDKGSFIVSARRTYADLLLRLSSDAEVNNSMLHFYDFNLKANYWLGKNDRIYLSGYWGRDAMGFEDAVDISWGNKTGTFRWNHLFSDRLFLNSSLIVSNFNHTSEIDDENETGDAVSIISDISNVTVKQDYQYFQDLNNTYSFGMNYTYHTFLPGEIKVNDNQEKFDLRIGKRSSHQAALYLSHEYNYNSRLSFDYGLRYSMFYVSGDGDNYNIEDLPGYIDLQFHGKENKFYSGFEPRITINYKLNNSSSLKFGYARNYQYLHKVSTALVGSIIDIWQPVGKKIAPQKSDLFSLGYYKNIDSDNYEFSVEAYYKDLRNQLEFKNGAILFFGNFFESEYVSGRGWSYGIEFLLKKNAGNLTGWLGYSLSKTEKEFPDLNNGKTFPSKYDRTHDFSFVLNYKISDNWNVSANWVYYTGNALTIPSGQYTINGKTVDAYTPRNSFRMPDYHRLDLGITYTTDGGGKWQLALYNAYARKNAYSIYFRERNPGYNEAVRLAIFTIVPSLSYSFEF